MKITYDKKIENKTFGAERALYMLRGAYVKNCRFEGEEDGESAFKEGADILAEACFYDLRYPFWHDKNLVIRGGEMTQKCRAALWYDEDVEIEGCCMHGIKALRECKRVNMTNCDVISPEFGWNCSFLSVKGGAITSEYAFMNGKNITLDGVTFTGKYSFQYNENLHIRNSVLNTKDAFWHVKHAVIEDSEVNGEYLGWYSEALTLVRCKIRGTQPLCYCKRLTLIDCTMEGCDLAFEYSDVQATVHSKIDSVKNVRSGKVVAKSFGEIIRSESVYPVEAELKEE